MYHFSKQSKVAPPPWSSPAPWGKGGHLLVSQKRIRPHGGFSVPFLLCCYVHISHKQNCETLFSELMYTLLALPHSTPQT